jgi:hypothetical protein
MNHVEWLAYRDRCAPKMFVGWAADCGAETPAEAVAACPRGEWLLWVAEQLGYDPDERLAAVRPTRLRAVREHAAAALDAAGLAERATALRSLPNDVSMVVASRAAVDAEFAAASMEEARRAASCAYAASLCSPEAAAGWAAGAAEWAAWPKGEAAERAAWRAEHARCAAEVRAALPDLAARWGAAIEVEAQP